MKVYPTSKVKCVFKIRMQRERIIGKGEYVDEVSETHIITQGSDMDEVFNVIMQEINNKVKEFLRNGSSLKVLK